MFGMGRHHGGHLPDVFVRVDERGNGRLPDDLRLSVPLDPPDLGLSAPNGRCVQYKRMMYFKAIFLTPL